MAEEPGGALKPMKATSDGVFQGENPLHSALPLAILQICVVVVLTRVLAFILRPLRQPRVIAEIIVSRSCYSSVRFVALVHVKLIGYPAIRVAFCLARPRWAGALCS